MRGHALFLWTLLLASLVVISNTTAARPSPMELSIPLTFVKNTGQLAEQYAFDVRSNGYDAMLFREGQTCMFPSKRAARAELRFD